MFTMQKKRHFSGRRDATFLFTHLPVYSMVDSVNPYFQMKLKASLWWRHSTRFSNIDKATMGFLSLSWAQRGMHVERLIGHPHK